MNQYLINTKIKEKIHRIQTLIFHILTVKGRPTEVYAELGKLGRKKELEAVIVQSETHNKHKHN